MMSKELQVGDKMYNVPKDFMTTPVDGKFGVIKQIRYAEGGKIKSITIDFGKYGSRTFYGGFDYLMPVDFVAGDLVTINHNSLHSRHIGQMCKVDGYNHLINKYRVFPAVPCLPDKENIPLWCSSYELDMYDDSTDEIDKPEYKNGDRVIITNINSDYEDDKNLNGQYGHISYYLPELNLYGIEFEDRDLVMEFNPSEFELATKLTVGDRIEFVKDYTDPGGVQIIKGRRGYVKEYVKALDVYTIVLDDFGNEKFIVPEEYIEKCIPEPLYNPDDVALNPKDDFSERLAKLENDVVEVKDMIGKVNVVIDNIKNSMNDIGEVIKKYY